MSLSPQQLFDAFRLDRQDLTIDGFALECLPHLRRHTAPPGGGESLLCFSRLSPGHELAQIREQIGHFRRSRQDFEWKVYALEQPSSLKALLEAEGFVADEGEQFMLYPLQSSALQGCSARRSLPAGLELRRLVDARDLDDVLAVQAQIWGRDFEWLRDKLSIALSHPESMSMFCAYADGRPIGTGWTDYPPGSRFPELHGGAVLADWRGQGVYSALFDVRFAEAKARGFEWMAVDASPMSRPILESMGFMTICETWPMRYRF
ncbi:GNAT family N-acetyltransferase [Paucibacter sp. Y2R2-4]|uniref:GNAT family N-acetyltransferase n=1 Tax=Paucibacter sp. Y2R2-4 TaxID=2893553 RepID=UPI0021E483D9|nr:GNAT family N-acetyltransferase [Paucibacter sp. Y2R2-4]MCV2348644.1 GNAT family N-acetyltransferase [Paucibacter sp. Y2R2-4]